MPSFTDKLKNCKLKGAISRHFCKCWCLLISWLGSWIESLLLCVPNGILVPVFISMPTCLSLSHIHQQTPTLWTQGLKPKAQMSSVRPLSPSSFISSYCQLLLVVVSAHFLTHISPTDTTLVRPPLFHKSMYSLLLSKINCSIFIVEISSYQFI